MTNHDDASTSMPAQDLMSNSNTTLSTTSNINVNMSFSTSTSASNNAAPEPSTPYTTTRPWHPPLQHIRGTTPPSEDFDSAEPEAPPAPPPTPTPSYALQCQHQRWGSHVTPCSTHAATGTHDVYSEVVVASNTDGWLDSTLYEYVDARTTCAL